MRTNPGGPSRVHDTISRTLCAGIFERIPACYLAPKTTPLPVPVAQPGHPA